MAGKTLRKEVHGALPCKKEKGEKMNGITVPMALVDFIPVALFFAAAVVLQRDLYNKMVKGAYALLAAGSILVLVSGIYKAGWKILYALNLCDFSALDISFFPMQAPGFLLVFCALAGMFTRFNKEKGKQSAMLMSVGVVPVYTSNVLFIVLQTIGCAGTQWCLFAVAKRMRKGKAMLLFVVSFVCMLGMGYLSAKFDDSSSMHWIAQTVNIVSQGALFAGVWILHKNGLAQKNALRQ